MTRIKDYGFIQIGENAAGNRQWQYTESRAWGYETISFWSLPDDHPAIGDIVEEGLLVKNKEQKTL